MSFWNELKKIGKKTLGVVKKVAAPVLSVAGTMIGGPIGGTVGNMVGGLLSPGSAGETSAPYITPINPNVPIVANAGVTVGQNGGVNFGGGYRTTPYNNGLIDYVNNESVDNRRSNTYSNNNINGIAIALGFGFLFLLND